VIDIQIFLKSGKELSVKRFHPWIFSGAISKINGSPKEGDVVEVFASDGSYLATGHWSPGSIAVRVFSFTQCIPDRNFFTQKIISAYRYRLSTGLADNPSTNVFRLVHGEGDGLPGLIIDIYGNVAVLQAHSAGFWHIRVMLAEIVIEIMKGAVVSVYDKSEGTLPFMANLGAENGYLAETPQGNEAVVLENDFKFKVNWQTGQKTGFFVDQRDNRQLLSKYSRGRTVLNMFGYTGGFSVYAMKNASAVYTVDSSPAATALADENVRLNFGDDTRHKAITSDAFSFLRDMEQDYDLIVLDPPAFAKHQKALSNALQGYHRLNAIALKKIKPGGLLFTFSCSQVVSREDFRKTIFVAAANSGRVVRILHQMSQPPDHPVNIYHPESEYLKGLVLHVE
jgi:23S rRNA (cytosine1962-C5)-methyltransferase